jgi:putative membrane protein
VETYVGIILRILINAAGLWVAVSLLDGLEFDGTPLALLGIALIMGVANVLVRPVVTLLSLPLILLTLGLFLLVVNAIVLSLVVWLAESLELGLTSESFWWTLAGAFVISLVSWGMEALFKRN